MPERVIMDDDRFRPISDDEREQAGSSQASRSAKEDDWDLIVPIPDAVPDPDMHHGILGDPARVWTYRDENGDRVCFIGRYNKADGDKEFRPRTWQKNRTTGREEWRWKNLPEPRPLYGLDLIALRPNGLVIVTEGEKACDAAGGVFTADVVVSPMNGARSPHKTDWQALKGRDVIIWPDNDAVGADFAVAIARLLKNIAASIRVVDVEKLVTINGGRRGYTHNPDGWDAGDAVLEWDNLFLLRTKAMELAKPYEDDGTCTDNTTVPGGDQPDQEKIQAELRQRIDALNGTDERGARAIVADAVKAGLSELAVATLIKPWGAKFGLTEAQARKFWQKIEKEIRAAEDALKDKKRETLSREEHEAKVRERARKLEEERAATRQRLELSCREIANDPKLLTRLTEVARRAGVVGEDASLRGAYIAASSRFNRRKAISLLRRGAPAGGKNFVTDTVLRFIPDEDVVRVSSGSPLSLVYYGGEDEDALKHKIIYVAEAAILAERNGVESPLTIMLRLPISEGRIDHQVAVTRPNAPAATMHIRRNGPVAVLITSARNNIEEELLTRLMPADADESQKQTVNVLAAALTDDEDDKEVRAEIDRWLDYQRWIALDAPYDVVIPFRRAILRAILARQKAAEERGEKPKFRLRIRRDIHGFLTAIQTSAILHKAQREKDERGRIVATIDDYRSAHEAFDPGLASLYKIVSPLTTIAVVRAIEEMGATTSKAVKVTVTTLMEKLGITGRGVANERLHDAEERGYIELVDKAGGYGKTTPREYKIIKYAVEIENEIKTQSAPGVFPSPEAVEAELKILSEEPVSPRYSGTDGTRSASDPNCTDYTTVPERQTASEEIFKGGESTPKADCTDCTNEPAAGHSSNHASGNPKESGKPPRWSLEL
jgi:hypothetical protein